MLIVVRVEKYRPNTLNDVSGHKDILATINKFIDSNVSNYISLIIGLEVLKLKMWHDIATSSSTTLRPTGHR